MQLNQIILLSKEWQGNAYNNNQLSYHKFNHLIDLYRFYGEKKKHVITTQTEHKCVLDSCRAIEAEGYRVTYLPVQTNGIIKLEDLDKAITPDTSLVSIMTVNNEIGVQQPITAIGALCKSKNVFFHTDAAQAVGKIPIDVNASNISLMSISGHKIYGPKGKKKLLSHPYFGFSSEQVVAFY